MKEFERVKEMREDGLLQEEACIAAELEDEAFNHYLAFLDALVKHQAEQAQYQDFLV